MMKRILNLSFTALFALMTACSGGSSLAPTTADPSTDGGFIDGDTPADGGVALTPPQEPVPGELPVDELPLPPDVAPDADTDGDGFAASVDCDDANDTINTAASEGSLYANGGRIPDGVDNNCNGVIDDRGPCDCRDFLGYKNPGDTLSDELSDAIDASDGEFDAAEPVEGEDVADAEPAVEPAEGEEVVEPAEGEEVAAVKPAVEGEEVAAIDPAAEEAASSKGDRANALKGKMAGNEKFRNKAKQDAKADAIKLGKKGAQKAQDSGLTKDDAKGKVDEGKEFAQNHADELVQHEAQQNAEQLKDKALDKKADKAREDKLDWAKHKTKKIQECTANLETYKALSTFDCEALTAEELQLQKQWLAEHDPRDRENEYLAGLSFLIKLVKNPETAKDEIDALHKGLLRIKFKGDKEVGCKIEAMVKNGHSGKDLQLKNQAEQGQNALDANNESAAQDVAENIPEGASAEDLASAVQAGGEMYADSEGAITAGVVIDAATDTALEDAGETAQESELGAEAKDKAKNTIKKKKIGYKLRHMGNGYNVIFNLSDDNVFEQCKGNFTSKDEYKSIAKLENIERIALVHGETDDVKGEVGIKAIKVAAHIANDARRPVVFYENPAVNAFLGKSNDNGVELTMPNHGFDKSAAPQCLSGILTPSAAGLETSTEETTTGVVVDPTIAASPAAPASLAIKTPSISVSTKYRMLSPTLATTPFTLDGKGTEVVDSLGKSPVASALASTDASKGEIVEGVSDAVKSGTLPEFIPGQTRMPVVNSIFITPHDKIIQVRVKASGKDTAPDGQKSKFVLKMRSQADEQCGKDEFFMNLDKPTFGRAASATFYVHKLDRDRIEDGFDALGVSDSAHSINSVQIRIVKPWMENGKHEHWVLEKSDGVKVVTPKDAASATYENIEWVKNMVDEHNGGAATPEMIVAPTE